MDYAKKVFHKSLNLIHIQFQEKEIEAWTLLYFPHQNKV